MATSVENITKFQPIQSDFQRFMRDREKKKAIRPKVYETARDRLNKYFDKDFLEEEDQPSKPNVTPKSEAEVKETSDGVERMQRRMRESLGEKDETPTITVSKKAKEQKKPRFIAGFEKAGKPSTIRVGGSKSKFTPEQLESRKRMLRRNAVFGRK